MHNGDLIDDIVKLVETHFPALKCDRFCECGKLESQHVMKMFAHGNFCPDLVLQRFSPLRGIPLACGSGDVGRTVFSLGEGAALSGSTTICQCGNSLSDCDCPEPDPREELYDDPARGAK